MKGIVFDIKRFTIHDGPGIRSTVFTKGCPLDCLWCQNPEGRAMAVDLWYFSNKCIRCGKCTKSCPTGALLTDNGDCHIRIDRNKCISCGRCTEVCPSKALAFDGREMDSTEVVEELLKDRIFYDTSDGGITISGGDPLVQYDFNIEILKRCKEEGLHTAIETCLHAKPEIVDVFMDVTDLFITDFKLFDLEKHKKYTGAGNELIKTNFANLVQKGADILLRIPLIPDFMATEENIMEIGKYIFAESQEFLC